MKKLLISLILLTLFFSGCWAPRCPIKSCDVAQEHRHSVPKGTYSGRPIYSKWRFHNYWSKKERKKRKDNPSESSPSGGRRKMPKAKKLFDWERE